MSEAFEVQFKNSIRYGMTYNQFWLDDPQLYYTYEEAYIDGLKEHDVFNWQLGQYILMAVGSWLSKDCKYPKEPAFYATQERQQENLSMKDKFMMIMEQVNRKFE